MQLSLVCVLFDPAIPTSFFNLFNCFYTFIILVGILHQNFRLSLTLSLLHIIIKEASRYNLVFVP